MFIFWRELTNFYLPQLINSILPDSLSEYGSNEPLSTEFYIYFFLKAYFLYIDILILIAIKKQKVWGKYLCILSSIVSIIYAWDGIKGIFHIPRYDNVTFCVEPWDIQFLFLGIISILTLIFGILVKFDEKDRSSLLATPTRVEKLHSEITDKNSIEKRE